MKVLITSATVDRDTWLTEYVPYTKAAKYIKEMYPDTYQKLMDLRLAPSNIVVYDNYLIITKHYPTGIRGLRTCFEIHDIATTDFSRADAIQSFNRLKDAKKWIDEHEV